MLRVLGLVSSQSNLNRFKFKLRISPWNSLSSPEITIEFNSLSFEFSVNLRIPLLFWKNFYGKSHDIIVFEVNDVFSGGHRKNSLIINQYNTPSLPKRGKEISEIFLSFLNQISSISYP